MSLSEAPGTAKPDTVSDRQAVSGSSLPMMRHLFGASPSLRGLADLPLPDRPLGFRQAPPWQCPDPLLYGLSSCTG
ncbi:hypothetical protein [Streptomyces roseochromogenus]|uniref:Uncharacterized protein n=1 Tax=Streptomyces roseochromogenus subsp. oscitans DS 12.976 TaxID=1352936 RepID=V6L5G2_STRRC|nr:hypothetical protein [Streptomyces roseochromogenus]EST36464.1 hypothetical protein M878_01910 [Streptomyces roseochromogenus subsp. oscitans DS 12.976]